MNITNEGDKRVNPESHPISDPDDKLPDVRPRITTEKAKLERIHMLKDRQKGTPSNVSKRRNVLANYMIDENNLHIVKIELDKLKEPCLS